MKRAIVTGAGGFIGSHLIKYLKKKDYWVRGIDKKYPQYSKTEADEFQISNLVHLTSCLQAIKDVDEVYALAADMGGMEFISTVKADILSYNALININTVLAVQANGIKKIFFASSACIYPESRQMKTDVIPLKESDAYPAAPDTEYGWEKLFSERLYQSFQEDYDLNVRIARFHNIFGSEGIYDGIRAKAPAAICRKVAQAKDGGDIEIWGDGKQTRSFCYIDDCLEGIYKLMESDYNQPLNIGSDRLVTIDEVVDIVCKIAGKNLTKIYQLDKPQGVKGRNSDNTLCRKILNWEPKIPLEEGLTKTYQWINEQIHGKN